MNSKMTIMPTSTRCMHLNTTKILKTLKQAAVEACAWISLVMVFFFIASAAKMVGIVDCEPNLKSQDIHQPFRPSAIR